MKSGTGHPGKIRRPARHRSRRQWLVAAVGGVLGLGALLGVVVAGYLVENGGGTTATMAPGSGEPALSEAAPTVRLASWSGGGTIDLRSPGKPTVLLAMAGWCATCVPPARSLATIQEEFGDRVQVIAFSVDPGESEETLRGFRKAAGEPAYLWGFDNNGTVAQAFELRYLDTVVVLDANGRELLRKVRPSNDELRAALRPLVASGAPGADGNERRLAAVQSAIVMDEESEAEGQASQAAMQSSTSAAEEPEAQPVAVQLVTPQPEETLSAEESEDGQTSQPTANSNQGEENIPSSSATIHSAQPTVTVSQAAGGPMDLFAFSLSGFAPQELVVISFVPPDDETLALAAPPNATLTVDDSGGGSFALRPVDNFGPIIPGAWIIHFAGEVSGATSTATIELVCAC